MKKLFILLTLVIVAMSASAQFNSGTTDSGYDHFHSSTDKYMIYYNGTDADTIGTGDSILTKTILLNTDAPLKYEFYVDADTVTGLADSCIFYLETKKHTDDTYTIQDSVKWYGSTDTTFSVSETSTGVPARYWRLRQKGYSDSFKSELKKWNIMLWE